MKQFLLKRCGNASCKGFEFVAYILENYTYPIKISEVYEEIADEYEDTPQAIERNIRSFKEKCGYQNITNHEFLSILLIEAEE